MQIVTCWFFAHIKFQSFLHRNIFWLLGGMLMEGALYCRSSAGNNIHNPYWLTIKNVQKVVPQWLKTTIFPYFEFHHCSIILGSLKLFQVFIQQILEDKQTKPDLIFTLILTISFEHLTLCTVFQLRQHSSLMTAAIHHPWACDTYNQSWLDLFLTQACSVSDLIWSHRLGTETVKDIFQCQCLLWNDPPGISLLQEAHMN